MRGRRRSNALYYGLSCSGSQGHSFRNGAVNYSLMLIGVMKCDMAALNERSELVSSRKTKQKMSFKKRLYFKNRSVGAVVSKKHRPPLTSQGWLLFSMVAIAAGSLSGGSAEQKINAWPPKTFPVTAWCSPPDAFITTEQYRRMSDAGFTVVMPPCEGTASPERNHKILATALATGLKAIIADPRMPLALTGNPSGKSALDAIVRDYHRSPALLGYFLTDEPGANQFDGLAEVVAYLKKIDPEHMVYINLLPNYATTNQQIKKSQLGTDTYDQYLEAYIRIVKPDVVSYDHYHFLKDADRVGFLGNLNSVQHAANQNPPLANIPFWQIVLSVEHGPYRALSENELRYEAMQTLAYGGKGLSYFAYWIPNDASFEWNNAMMTKDGMQGALYDAAKKVNKDVRTLAKYLYSAHTIGTYQTGKIPVDGIPLGNESVVRIENPADLTVGIFRDPYGFVYLLFTNRDYKKPVLVQAILHVKEHPVERLNMNDGKFLPVKNPRDAEGEMKLDIELEPAGAALVRWQ